MAKPTLTRKQSQEVDRRAIAEFGMTGLTLMENAGRGVACTLCKLGARGPISIFCGRGNNAGDGFVIARHLDLRGIEVRVVLCSQPDQLKGDAAANFQIIARSGLCIETLSDYDQARMDGLLAGADWVVDALLGTGSSGDPRPPLDAVIDDLNDRQLAPILAVDLPSGLDCDSGAAGPHVIRAAHTCTFVAAKRGFLAPGAERYTGQVHVLDIGAPRKLVEEILREAAKGDSLA